MKKTFTFLFFISFLSILLFSGCNQKQQQNQVGESTTSSAENPVVPQNQPAEKLYEKLLASFGDDWMERESDPDLYPEYFGGAFVDNNGKFVVTVTGSIEAQKNRLTEILETDNFKVETVQYSYRQMMRVMDKIDAFLMNSTIPEDHPLMSLFAGAYPDVMENRVKILLTKVDDTTIRLFKKDVVDSPMLLFEKGELPEIN